MKYCVITFRSVTPAQRAENVLRHAGYECSVRRTPRWMEEQGCGYSLRVRTQDVTGCVALLRSNSLSFRKIYLQEDNAVTEELNI